MLHADSGKRSWDLKGATSVSGTPLGAYAYGSTADADTRHFMFVRIKSAEEVETGIKQLPAEGVQTMTSANKTDSETLYDLSGRKVTSGSLKKGIYIKGGKKVTF